MAVSRSAYRLPSTLLAPMAWCASSTFLLASLLARMFYRGSWQPKEKSSLHHVSGDPHAMNAYQATISSVGNILRWTPPLYLFLSLPFSSPRHPLPCCWPLHVLCARVTPVHTTRTSSTTPWALAPTSAARCRTASRWFVWTPTWISLLAVHECLEVLICS
jgi:hypothetical protein